MSGIHRELQDKANPQELLSALPANYTLSVPLWTECLQRLREGTFTSSLGLRFTVTLAKELSPAIPLPTGTPLILVLQVLTELADLVVLPTLQSISSCATEAKSVLQLLEIALKRVPMEAILTGKVPKAAVSALDKLTFLLPEAIESYDSESKLVLMRTAMTLMGYVGLVVGNPTEDVDRLLQALKKMLEKVEETGRQGLDTVVSDLGHNYWTCRPKCRFCEGAFSSFRYALVVSLCLRSEASALTVQASSLLLCGLRQSGLSVLLYLDYLCLYFSLSKPSSKPRLLPSVPRRLFDLYFTMKKNAQEDAFFPKLPSFSLLISHIFSVIATDLGAEGYLPALITLISGCESPDQQFYSYSQLNRLILANSTSRNLAISLGIAEILLENCDFSQPICEILERIPLNPVTVAYFLQRLQSALISDKTASVLILKTLISAINFNENTAIRSIKSLGGLRIFLPALEFIGKGESELRLLVLRVIETARSLINDEFVEMLSLTLAETAQKWGFDEETVILVLGLFSEHQTQHPVSSLSADCLLFTPAVWSTLPSPLYQTLIFPIQLACFAHAIKEGSDLQVRRYGYTLLSEISQRRYQDLSNTEDEVLSQLDHYLNSAKSAARACDLLYLSLQILPLSTHFSMQICLQVREALKTKRLFTEQKDHHELVAILRAFTPWLEKDGSELGPKLVQVHVASCSTSRVTLLGLTGKFSVKQGFDDDQLAVLRDIAVTIDWETYDILCAAWPHRNVKSPKWLTRAYLLADLIPRSKSSCLLRIWTDFFQKLVESGEPWKLQSAEGYTPKWLVSAFDRLVRDDLMAYTDEAIWPTYEGKYWDKVVKLLLSGDNCAPVGVFVRLFWQPEKPQRDRQFREFFLRKLWVVCPSSISKDLMYHLLMAVESAVAQYPILSLNLPTLLLLCVSKCPHLTAPYPRGNALSPLPYDKVFASLLSLTDQTPDFSVGGFRRVLASLATLSLRMTAQYPALLTSVLPLVFESRPEGRIGDDLFANEGYIEAYFLTELLLWYYETRDNSVLSIILDIERNFQISSRIGRFVEENVVNFGVYFDLRSAYFDRLVYADSGFKVVDSEGLRTVLGIWPGREMESSEADSRAKLVAFPLKLAEMLTAEGVARARELVENPTWQDVVYLYLLVNTHLRLRPYITLTQEPPPTDPPEAATQGTQFYIPRISAQEQTYQLRLMYIQSHWKAVSKALKGVYGLWSASSSGTDVYWKVVNFVDGDGRRTRVKRKKDGSGHREAELRRPKKDIIKSITEIPMVRITPPESPIIEPSPTPSSPSIDLDFLNFPDSRFSTTSLPNMRQFDPRVSDNPLPVFCERITCLLARCGQLDLTKDYFIYSTCDFGLFPANSKNFNLALVRFR